MRNKVLESKINNRELEKKYVNGLIIGSRLVLNDVLKQAEEEGKSDAEKLQNIIEYCNLHKSRLSNKKDNYEENEAK